MPPFLGCQCWYFFDDRTLFPGAKDILAHCVHADLFFWNLEGMNRWFVRGSLFWQDTKLYWKPCFSRAVPQNYLRDCLPGYSPQFGWNKTLFYSNYRLFIDYFCQQAYSSMSGLWRRAWEINPLFVILFL